MFKLSVLSVLSLLVSTVRGAPAPGNEVERSPIKKRAVPSPPNFVVYSDDYVTNVLPPVADIAGFNVFAISFLWSTGGQDQAQNWEELTPAERNSSLATYHDAGISVIVSAFGSVPLPTSDGEDPTTTAQFMADWVIQYGLDGIDVDYEDLGCFKSTTCDPESWLQTFTTTLRQTLTQGDYILTHAPLAPWFSSTYGWTNGGYLAIDKAVGDLVDWYNIQFYNQGTTEYTTCAGLLNASSSAWPETALFQIAANGVSLDKLAIGKPATMADASNGWMDTATLTVCLLEAGLQGWNAGVMSWQYPHANASWIAAVWQGGSTSTSSVSSISTSTTTSTTSSASTTSTTSTTTSSGSGSGTCAGISPWSSATAYPQGSQVTYNGDVWTADQWNQNETPGGSSGAWTNAGACATAAPTVPGTFSVPVPTAKITATPSASAAGEA